MTTYQPERIESYWQKEWESQQTYRCEFPSHKPKKYILDMFPYPSSQGLHVGHVEPYTASDILARYYRAQGFNVLHPMGWDAFGLPAEQHALATGIHPAVTTQTAIDNFRVQLKRLGLSYDWSRELSTADPSFYRFTQLIFIKLFEKNLAYQKEVAVNWCPALRTVLANEEVVNGRSERGSHPVFRVLMKQWMLKITAYAERLLADLDSLDWPESTKTLQRNWIGKSEGLQTRFAVQDKYERIEIFTTRPDTLWGVTFLVLAPEHPLVAALTTPEQQAGVTQYQMQVAQKSELLRQDPHAAKTGVFTGSFAINPVNEQLIPIWIADYVLSTYGTGAIMAVPAHDERDFSFAKVFQLPIKQVVVESGSGGGDAAAKDHPSPAAADGVCFSGLGKAVHSDWITGLGSLEASAKVIAWMEARGLGQRQVHYRLRDWLFSRQRYWGEPFPVYHDEQKQPRMLSPEELPLCLPEVTRYEPTEKGESPLESLRSWVEIFDPKTGERLRRETDTMPGSAGSSWYFLRFCDPHHPDLPFAPEAERYWMPVDIYIGGPEHAVGHLLYARFWTKVLFDAGWVSYAEPFTKLVHQGMILGEDGEKMSKSRGNTIHPEAVIADYGADTLRVYEMFMGPLERDKPWSTQAIDGVYRFLERCWRMVGEVTETAPSEHDLRITHQTIQKVTRDIEHLRFNTAISQMMIFVNTLTPLIHKPRACLVPFVQLLHPFAPHLAHELWRQLGQTSALSYEAWPAVDAQWVQARTLHIAVQVMGKTKSTLEVAVDATAAEIEQQVRALPSVQRQLEGKKIKKVIYVPQKVINFVVS